MSIETFVHAFNGENGHDVAVLDSIIQNERSTPQTLEAIREIVDAISGDIRPVIDDAVNAVRNYTNGESRPKKAISEVRKLTQHIGLVQYPDQKLEWDIPVIYNRGMLPEMVRSYWGGNGDDYVRDCKFPAALLYTIFEQYEDIRVAIQARKGTLHPTVSLEHRDKNCMHRLIVGFSYDLRFEGLRQTQNYYSNPIVTPGSPISLLDPEVNSRMCEFVCNDSGSPFLLDMLDWYTLIRMLDTYGHTSSLAVYTGQTFLRHYKADYPDHPYVVAVEEDLVQLNARY